MIGIFGGTFNPVHFGHLRAVLEAGELFALRQVRLIPNKLPPHRSAPAVSAEMRLAMLRLAVEKLPGAIVDTLELEREGPSYMVDTLRSLRAEFPTEPMLLCIGVDAYNGLTDWHRWHELFDYAHIAVLTRPGYEPRLAHSEIEARRIDNRAELMHSLAGSLIFQPITELNISASAIRAMLAAQRSPRYLLPDAVLDYIYCNSLYYKSD